MKRIIFQKELFNKQEDLCNLPFLKVLRNGFISDQVIFHPLRILHLLIFQKPYFLRKARQYFFMLWDDKDSLWTKCFFSVAEPVVLPSVMPGDSFAIPLHLTSWRLQARPKGMGVFFCKSPIHWTNVQKASEISSSKRECHAMESENSRFFRWPVLGKVEWLLCVCVCFFFYSLFPDKDRREQIVKHNCQNIWEECIWGLQCNLSVCSERLCTVWDCWCWSLTRGHCQTPKCPGWRMRTFLRSAKWNPSSL